MDIVYLFKEDIDNDSEELRYSLRSLQNVPHQNVFIIGEMPNWVQNVTHIPIAQDKTKVENVKKNLYAAISNKLVSDDFIMMNDDFFIMKPIEEIPNLNFGDMKSLINQYEVRYPSGSEYIDTMKGLYNLLIERGYENPTSYELHVPFVVNKQKGLELYSYAKDSSYQFRTFYGNYFHIGGTTVDDVKIFIDPRHNNPSYNNNPNQYLSDQVFLSATGGSFKKDIAGNFIRSKFPLKSKYEL